LGWKTIEKRIGICWSNRETLLKRLLREGIKNLHLLRVTTIKGSVVIWDQEEKNQRGITSEVVGEYSEVVMNKTG